MRLRHEIYAAAVLLHVSFVMFVPRPAGSAACALPLQVYVCLLSAVQVDSSVAPPVARAAEALVTEALGAPLVQLLQVRLDA